MLKIERLLSPGLIIAGGKWWSAGLTRGRTKKCELCRGRIVSGDDAYRPVREGDGIVRYMRICCGCVRVYVVGERVRYWRRWFAQLDETRAVGPRRTND